MSETNIPDVKVLDSIAPVLVENKLDSPAIHKNVMKFTSYEGQMWDEFLKAEDDSIDEEFRARELESLYLLKAAQRNHLPVKDRLSAIRNYNSISESRYGMPDPEEARRLISLQLQRWKDLPSHSPVAALYSSLVGNAEIKPDTSEALPLEEMRQALYELCPEVHDVIAELPEGSISPRQVRAALAQIRRKLVSSDTAWAKWKITNPKGSTMLSTNSETQEWRVPDGRVDFKGKEELEAVLYHEVVAHAMRSVMGRKTGDRRLSYSSLPGNEGFEEGFGKLIELIIRGKREETAYDRYIDIALATGVIDGRKFSKEELVAIHIIRSKTRAMANGKESESLDKLTKKAKSSMLRIFRGGDGVAVRDQEGRVIDQAVTTKDIAYHAEFGVACDYFLEMIDKGFTPKQILEYILKGKFDPTDPKHTKYAEQYGIKL